jgi:replicative DNA helicase
MSEAVGSASADVELLRLLATRENYDKYRDLVKPYTLLPEANQLIEDMGAWFGDNAAAPVIDWGGFLTYLRVTRHTGWRDTQHKQFEAIVNNVASQPNARPDIVDRFVELDYASRIREVVDGVISSDKGKDLSGIDTLISDYRSAIHARTQAHVVTSDLSELLNQTVKSGGLEWNLEDLNRAVGPIRQGDLVLLAARPESGKTSFICNELVYMTPQLPPGKHAIIFNNEERGAKIGLRLHQAALGASSWDLASSPGTHTAAYQAALKGHRIDVYHKTDLSVEDANRVLRSGEYGLICFNVISKVDGFRKLDGVERFGRLAQWCRSVADQYGPVFCVAQADASAEGHKWLDQSQVYWSKTGVQGEIDVQLMLGRSNEASDDDKRFLSVVKNKGPYGPRVDPDRAHGKFEVSFDRITGRYKSLSYPNRGTSP